ncbi:hypothetical protein HPB52_024736 [Rhipicephalus sanguineus]|uniref:Uncharacterized protein n=1 Tax=Rhipicephalus sanguineus TaxID=34632 RepID=A0A9D4PBB0_RHISA|nr:hypothetical protein HPB52_024736 [Rhipicephalus sanguineus]
MMVTAVPFSKGKRVSIDPHPTIESLTPESSSPTPSAERDIMRRLPIIRQSSDGGASSSTSDVPGSDEQVETTVESGKGPVQAVRKSFAKGRNSSGGKRGTRTFVHSEPVMLELLTDRHPLLSTTLVARRKPRHWQLLVFAIGIVVASLLAAFVSLMVLGRNRVPIVSRVSVCATNDCIEYARRLSHRMNTSANPCNGGLNATTGSLQLAGVLDILFDLAVNWRVALWFDVRVSQLAVDGGLVMTLEEPGPVPLYRMEQLSDLEVQAYGDAVRAVALFLTEGTREHDAWVLTDGTDHGFNVTADEWATLVNKYVAASGFSSSTT